MSQLARIYADKPGRYLTKSYAAFRLTELGRTVSVQLSDLAVSVGDAADMAQIHCAHKDKLIIREIDEEAGAVKLHLFSIKQQSRATWTGRGIDAQRFHKLYAEPVCVIDATTVLNSIEREGK